MSPEHASLIRATWAEVAPRADAVAEDFYRRLFMLSPEATALFAHVNMRHQREKFVAMLTELIRVLDDPGLLVSEAVPSGRRHVSYGTRAEHYAFVGAALFGAMEHALGTAWTPDVRDAWRELYTLVSAAMLRAGERPAAHR